MDSLAWNNGTGLGSCLVGSPGTEAMVNRDSRGHPYSAVRGEILGFAEDEPPRKRLPRMFSLIKNESRGFEDDQIPS